MLPSIEIERVDLRGDAFSALQFKPPCSFAAFHESVEPRPSVVAPHKLANDSHRHGDFAAGIAMAVAFSAVGLKVEDEAWFWREQNSRCVRKPLRPSVKDNSVIGRSIADTSVSAVDCRDLRSRTWLMHDEYPR